MCMYVYNYAFPFTRWLERTQTVTNVGQLRERNNMPLYG